MRTTLLTLVLRAWLLATASTAEPQTWWALAYVNGAGASTYGLSWR